MGQLVPLYVMEYKFVELLSLNFLSSPEDVVRQQISYRWGRLYNLNPV
jgi:hypothetical protein